MAIVVAPGGSNGDDLAVASVVKLRPGVDDPIFREIFRAAYDRVACEQAGGVAGSQSTTIAGRDVLVGTCAGGATPTTSTSPTACWCRSPRSGRASSASRSSRACRSRLARRCPVHAPSARRAAPS